MCVISTAIAIGTAVATAASYVASAAAAVGSAVAAGASAVGSTVAAGASAAWGAVAGGAAAASSGGWAFGATMAPVWAFGATEAGVAAGSGGLWATIGVGALAVGSAVAGGVISTVSSIQQAEAQEEQAQYMADVQERNAKLAAVSAEHIGIQASQEREALRNNMLETRGEARTRYAASGVVLGKGVANDYEADIADAYDLDQRNLDYDIKSRQWQSRMAAYNYASQSAIYQNQADAYAKTKTPSLLGGLFSTGAGAASALGGTIGTAQNFGWIAAV